MKKIFIITLLLLVVTLVSAQKKNGIKKENCKFQITYMYCDSIIIGVKGYGQNDIFTYNQITKWRGKLCDSFKALQIGGGYMMFEYGRSKDGRNLVYIKSCKSLHKSIESAHECLSDTFYVFSDTLFVNPCQVMDSSNYFIVRYKNQKYVVPTIDENIFFLKLSDYKFEFNEENMVRLRISMVKKNNDGNEIEESVTSNMVIKRMY